LRPLVLIAAGLFVMFGVPDVSLTFRIPWITVTQPAEVTAVVLVYEKDDHAIAPDIRAALNTLNRRGILATVLEADTTSGSGQVPTQYRLPLEAARKAGLPCLVVMAGETVLRAVTKPTSRHVEEVGK